MATVSDNFNRANGSIGANWTTSGGTWTVTSNQAHLSSGGGRFFAAYSGAALTGADMLVSVLLASGNGGCIARATSDAATCYFTNAWSGGHREIWKNVASTATFLSEPGSVTFGSSRLTFKSDGSTLTIGVEGSGTTYNITDSSITTGSYAGIAADGNEIDFDNFEGSDLGGAAVFTAAPPRVLNQSVTRAAYW